jgi:hypothetical protein
MRVGVGVVDNTQRFHEMKGNCYMARVIDFYIPKNFRRKTTAIAPSKPGKVIAFCLSKRSA